MIVYSSENQVNAYTNTKSFAQKFNQAAPRLRVRHYKTNGNQVDIGPAHSDFDAKIYHNIDKASKRDTDIIFGKKDRNLHTEIPGPAK